MQRVLAIAGLLLLPGAALAEVTDYSAGKSPAQLFSGDCAACHNSPRGLAKGRDQSALANFLREHYTTRAETAGALAAYLLGNPGPAPDPRNAGRQPRGTPASAPAPAAAPKPADDDPFRRIFRSPSAEPEQDEGSIVAPEPGEAKPDGKAKGKPRTAARPPAERSPKDAAKEKEQPKEQAKEKEKEPAKEAARPKKPDSADAAREAAAKAEEAAKEAAAKEAAAKAEAAKAEAAKVRAYVTGGEPASRAKESAPAPASSDRPGATPPG